MNDIKWSYQIGSKVVSRIGTTEPVRYNLGSIGWDFNGKFWSGVKESDGLPITVYSEPTLKWTPKEGEWVGHVSVDVDVVHGTGVLIHPWCEERDGHLVLHHYPLTDDEKVKIIGGWKALQELHKKWLIKTIEDQREPSVEETGNE